jgi:hypothetical protein
MLPTHWWNLIKKNTINHQHQPNHHRPRISEYHPILTQWVISQQKLRHLLRVRTSCCWLYIPSSSFSPPYGWSDPIIDYDISTILPVDEIETCYLIGGRSTPLKNIRVRQLGWWNSQLNGTNVPNHQPALVLWLIFLNCWIRWYYHVSYTSYKPTD